MPRNKSSEIRVRPVRKDKPDVRALARVLIELALAESAEAPDAAENEAKSSAQDAAGERRSA